MTSTRGLTRLLSPLTGEAFRSYVDRLAAWHKVTRAVMLCWLGLLKDRKCHCIPGLGIVLDRVSLERFSIASQLPRAVVAKMLLSTYDGIALDLSTVSPDRPDSVRICTFSEWAYFSGSHACPHCLREDHGAWNLAWKLPWTFACVKHQCYLVSHCPACSTRLAKENPVGHLPVPGRCNNLCQDNKKGRAALLCGYDLAQMPTIAASLETLRLQRLLNEYLNGRATKILCKTVPSLEYFRDLRATCALILRCAEPKDFDYLPTPEAASLNSFTDERNHIIAARNESIADFRNRRIKPFNAPPIAPELMAALARIAIPILAADAPLMAELLRPLTERCRTTSGGNRWRIVKLGFSDPVSTLLVKNMEVNSTFDRAVGRRSVATREAQFSLQPKNIPTLLWPEEFRRKFLTLFPTVQENKARCFCSIALVKICGNYTWRQSAAQLGLTVQEGKSPVHRCVLELRKTNARNAFGEALHDLARSLSDTPKKIDYAARREALANLKIIPFACWSEICHAAGIPPGVYVRRKNAAIWLWAELTGGDWRLAPAIAEARNAEYARRFYCQQRERVIPAVAAGLRAYGSQLLPMESFQP